MTRLTLTAALVALGTAAQAQGIGTCADRPIVIARLLTEANGRQQQTSFGLQHDRKVLEIFANAEGTWTGVGSMPNGRSCVVMEGEGWTNLRPIPVGDPS